MTTTRPGDFFMFYKTKQADGFVQGTKNLFNSASSATNNFLNGAPKFDEYGTPKGRGPGLGQRSWSSLKQVGTSALDGFKSLAPASGATGLDRFVPRGIGEAGASLREGFSTLKGQASNILPAAKGLFQNGLSGAAKTLGGQALGAVKGITSTGLKGQAGAVAGDLTGGFVARRLGGTGTSTGSTLVDIGSSLHPGMIAAKAITAPVAAGLGSYFNGNGRAAELGPRFGRGETKSGPMGKSLINNDTQESRHKFMQNKQELIRSSPALMDKHMLGKPPELRKRWF